MRSLVLCLAACLAVCCFPGKSDAQQCVGGQCGMQSVRLFSQPMVERVSTVSVADAYGIQLAPGEVLISVDGVPVEHVVRRDIGPLRAVASAVVSAASSLIVNRNERAYLHALREAEILARRRTAGHPLGVAPGCRYSGTGISLSADRPNHCYSELPESRLVARAMVQGADGRFYWSAHYR